jgi:hypothetical protein
MQKTMAFSPSILPDILDIARRTAALGCVA